MPEPSERPVSESGCLICPDRSFCRDFRPSLAKCCAVGDCRTRQAVPSQTEINRRNSFILAFCRCSELCVKVLAYYSIVLLFAEVCYVFTRRCQAGVKLQSVFANSKVISLAFSLVKCGHTPATLVSAASDWSDRRFTSSIRY